MLSEGYLPIFNKEQFSYYILSFVSSVVNKFPKNVSQIDVRTDGWWFGLSTRPGFLLNFSFWMYWVQNFRGLHAQPRYWAPQLPVPSLDFFSDQPKSFRPGKKPDDVKIRFSSFLLIDKWNQINWLKTKYVFNHLMFIGYINTKIRFRMRGEKAACAAWKMKPHRYTYTTLKIIMRQ